MSITPFICPSCGAPIPEHSDDKAMVCPYCGTISCYEAGTQTTSQSLSTYKPRKVEVEEPKSWGTTLFLAITTGMFGGHRFYTGRIGSALIQAFTIGGFYIWWFADIISILTNNFTDSKGRSLDKNKPINLVLVLVIGALWVLFFIGLVTSGFSSNNG
jgi:TM2 domain-containing membrane protein YozV/predicted RNA-binding Zn-ribbon protein involved in translation (DUF1610 family)